MQRSKRSYKKLRSISRKTKKRRTSSTRTRRSTSKRKNRRSNNKRKSQNRSRGRSKSRPRSKSRGRLKSRPKSCPKGQIMVKGYKRKSHSRRPYTKKNRERYPRSYVSGAKIARYCRKDLGAPGKTPTNKKVLPKPGNEFSLVSMGYSAYNSKKNRQTILKKAGKQYGYLKVLRHLNLRANYQQWNERAYNNMRSDVNFLSSEYNDWKKRMDRIYGKRENRQKSKKKRSRKKSK